VARIRAIVWLGMPIVLLIESDAGHTLQ
jgi:hypothetical protein